MEKVVKNNLLILEKVVFLHCQIQLRYAKEKDTTHAQRVF